MGWEFTATIDESDQRWRWKWRRVADDSGDVLAQSDPFERLEACIQDARVHGFDEESCSRLE